MLISVDNLPCKIVMKAHIQTVADPSHSPNWLQQLSPLHMLRHLGMQNRS